MTSGDAESDLDPSGSAPAALPDPASPEEWTALLRALQDRSGLSVRDLARRTRAPSSTIGGYLSGRHLPTPAHRDLTDRLLTELGVEPARRARLLDALARLRRTTTRPSTGPAPYRGLAGYTIEDAEWFVGREEATNRLLELVRRDPRDVVVVVGPSGSGKSSLLHAGLAAALAAEGWAVHTLTPGATPVEALAAVGSRLAEDAGPPSPAPESAPAPDRAPATLVVIDQLEELWTQHTGDSEVHAVLRTVHRLAARPGVVVAAGLRADFYSRALADADLARSLQTSQVVLGPMVAADLVRAVTEPATRAGVQVEPGLVEVLLRDLAPHGERADGGAHDPGALPLLGYALLQTWQRGGRHRLTLADYRASGGIAQAVAAAAEAAHSATDTDTPTDTGPHPAEVPAELERTTRRIFGRLVSVAEDTADTRRRVSRDELEDLGPAAADILERFIHARLLTADTDRVEITHEALLVAWPRLRGWLDADRAALLAQHRITESARHWREAGCDPELLPRGGVLVLARELLADADRWAALTAPEREYVLAGEHAHEDRVRERRRRTRRLQAVAAVLTATLIAVAGLAGYARHLQGQAQDQRDQALSRQLAEAANRLRSVDPGLAAQFALLGYRSADTTEARSALLDTTASPLARRLTGPGGPAAAAISGDGRLLVAAGDRGGLALWRIPGPGQRPVADRPVIAAQEEPLYTVAVSPDGSLVAAAGGFSGLVHVWETTQPGSPRELAGIEIPGLGVLALTFSADGRWLAAAGSGETGGAVHVWRRDGTAFRAVHLPMPDEREPGSTDPPRARGMQAVAFSPDGTVLAAGGEGGVVYRWSLRAPEGAASAVEPALTGPDGPTGTVTSLAFAPSGRELAAGSKDQSVYLWSLTGPSAAPAGPARTLTGARSWVNAITYSPDGATLVAGGSDSRLRWYELAGGTVFAEVAQPGPITAAVHAPDGATVITACADGLVRQWSLPLPRGPMTARSTFSLAYTGPDRLLAVSSRDALRAFDTATGMRPLAPALHAGDGTPGSVGFAGTVLPNPYNDVVLATGRTGLSWLHRRAAAGTLTPIGPLPQQQTTIIQTGTFAGKGTVVYTADDSSTLQVTDITDPTAPRAVGEPLATDGVLYMTTTAPNDAIMASGTGTTGLVQLWDLSDPRHPRVLAAAPEQGAPRLQVYGLAFSPDGTTLAVGSADGTLRLLDVRDPRAPRWLGVPVTGAGGYVYAVHYSADGRRVATAAGDGVVRVYDTSGPTLHLLASLTAMAPEAVYAVALHPSGTRLVAGGSTEAIVGWDLDPERAASRACTWLGDPVAPEEWARYLPSVPYSRPCP